MSVPLFHQETGDPAAPAVVVLHGLLGSSRNWKTVASDLAALPARVYSLDLRNHGQSLHAPEHTYAAMAEDVLAWMDRRGLARANLVGHSMGGKVAMRLACAEPGRVERLVVVDIAPRDYRSEKHRAEFAALAELPLTDLRSRQEAELRLEARVPDWAMRQFLLTNLERTAEGGWRWSVNLPVLTAALPEIERNVFSSEERYAGPTLVVAGGKSTYVRNEDMAEISRRFPAARVVVLPGAGHNPHIETRGEFVRAVGEFLRG